MARWNPWAAARTRPNLTIVYDDVPHGATWHRSSHGDVITIDAAATRRERRALLAHELIHVERGIGFPLATPATMEREEEIVRRETVRRLVPTGELAAFVARRAPIEPVTARLVGDEFDVPDAIADQALAALRRRAAEGGAA